MSFPKISAVEIPILQELFAVGGADDVRFLYAKLATYFPQLSEAELRTISAGTNANWRKIVQIAGRELDDKGYLKRARGFWTLTEKGKREVETESVGFEIAKTETIELNHQTIQKMLTEIGGILGYFSATEFEFYDVVWRETAKSPRLSHVFEVQSKGNIDSAFAKLKRAHDAQRSKVFLILATERDTNRAKQSLQREFYELADYLNVISFAQINRTHSNLKQIAEILPKLLEK